MSAAETNLSEMEALSRRVASLNSDARQLVDALAQVKRTRLVLVLALVAFVGSTCYAFYGLATRFQQKEQMDLLMRKAQERLAERNDFIMKDVQKLVDHSAPVVSKAFLDQAKKDLPAFLQGVQGERDKLVENLQAKLNERLKTHHELLLSRHEKLLREEFPAVQDEKLHEAMMANLNVAVDNLVRKYYIEELQSEMKALYGAWDEFPPSSPPEKGDLPLEDQLVANLLELLKIKLAETSSASPVAIPSATVPAAVPATVPPRDPGDEPAAAPAKEPSKEPAKEEPAKEPVKEPAKEPAKESAKEEPTKEPAEASAKAPTESP